MPTDTITRRLGRCSRWWRTELNVLADVIGGQLAAATLGVADHDSAVTVHAGDRPCPAVRDAEGRVVAVRHDHIASTEPLPLPGHDGALVPHGAGGDEPVTDRYVECGGVLASVDDHRAGQAGQPCGRDLLGQRVPPFDLAAVDGDLAAGA